MTKFLFALLLLGLLNNNVSDIENIIEKTDRSLRKLECYSISYILNMYNDNDVETQFYKVFENGKNDYRRIEISTTDKKNIVIFRNDSVYMIDPIEKMYLIVNYDDMMLSMIKSDIFESLRIIPYLYENADKEIINDKNGKVIVKFLLDESPLDVNHIFVKFNKSDYPETMEAFTKDNNIVLQTTFGTYENGLPHVMNTYTIIKEKMIREEIKISEINISNELPDSLFEINLVGLEKYSE